MRPILQRNCLLHAGHECDDDDVDSRCVLAVLNLQRARFSLALLTLSAMAPLLV